MYPTLVSQGWHFSPVPPAGPIWCWDGPLLLAGLSWEALLSTVMMWDAQWVNREDPFWGDTYSPLVIASLLPVAMYFCSWLPISTPCPSTVGACSQLVRELGSCLRVHDLVFLTPISWLWEWLKLYHEEGVVLNLICINEICKCMLICWHLPSPVTWIMASA